MPQDHLLSSRKADHIQINLEEDVQSSLITGLDRYRFVHCALPEISLDEVDLSLELFGKTAFSAYFNFFDDRGDI